ncbi:MAG: hypothetical protein ACK4VM_03770 [Bosea sp. (in: a-proteobacteria)]
MGRLTRNELIFVAVGGALGALVGFAAKAGWLGATDSFPPFIFLLLGLGLAEVAAGYVTQIPPGALVRMGARLLAFALGLGVLILITGRLA